MRSMRAGFSRVFHASPSDWTREDLAPLTGQELEVLARLMAVPHSGTKEQTVARLLDAAELRDLLSVYDNDPQPLADHFKRTELVALARRAGTFFSLPKRGIAAALLNWRNDCRRRGQAFLREWREATREASAGKPRQLHFRFDEQKDHRQKESQ